MLGSHLAPPGACCCPLETQAKQWGDFLQMQKPKEKTFLKFFQCSFLARVSRRRQQTFDDQVIPNKTRLETTNFKVEEHFKVRTEPQGTGP